MKYKGIMLGSLGKTALRSCNDVYEISRDREINKTGITQWAVWIPKDNRQLYGIDEAGNERIIENAFHQLSFNSGFRSKHSHK